MKRWLSLALALCLLTGLLQGSCLAALPTAEPLLDASPQMIVGAVENKIAEIYDLTGSRHTLHFPFTVEDYADLEDFKAQKSAVLHPLMTALFAADMKGRDHINVRTSYGMVSGQGRIKQYYYHWFQHASCNW